MLMGPERATQGRERLRQIIRSIAAPSQATTQRTTVRLAKSGARIRAIRAPFRRSCYSRLTFLYHFSFLQVVKFF